MFTDWFQILISFVMSSILGVLPGVSDVVQLCNVDRFAMEDLRNRGSTHVLGVYHGRGRD